MCQTNQRNSKINWSSEEEFFLAQICQHQKKPSWSAISLQLNEKFPSKSRTPKQCRERYINFVKSREESKGLTEWSQAQCTTLYEQYFEKGSKWVQISKLLPGRSQNSIKNRFYGSVRKLIRKMNAIQKQKSIRNLKLMKQCTMMKLLDAHTWFSQSNIQDLSQINFILTLRRNVLETLKKLESKIEKQTIVELIQQLTVFKSLTRFQTTKKLKIIHNSRKGQNFIDNQFIKWQASQKAQNQQISQEGYENREDGLNSDQKAVDQQKNQLKESMFQFGQQIDFYLQKRIQSKDLQYDVSQILNIDYESDRFNFQEWD